MEHLGIDTVELGKLAEYPGNPKLHDIPSLRASLRRLGQFESVIARRLPDGGLVLLKGHGITTAMREEGWEHARTEIIECDDDEARRILLAANRLQELGGYAEDLLAAQLIELGDDFDATGFDDVYTEALLLRTNVLADGASGFLDDPPRPQRDDDGTSGEPPPAPVDGFVLVSWLVPAEDRDLIREVVGKVKHAEQLGTAAEAVVHVFRAYAGEQAVA